MVRALTHGNKILQCMTEIGQTENGMDLEHTAYLKGQVIEKYMLEAGRMTNGMDMAQTSTLRMNTTKGNGMVAREAAGVACTTVMVRNQWQTVGRVR